MKQNLKYWALVALTFCSLIVACLSYGKGEKEEFRYFTHEAAFLTGTESKTYLFCQIGDRIFYKDIPKMTGIFVDDGKYVEISAPWSEISNEELLELLNSPAKKSN